MCEPVNSPICKKWSALGGESVLGASDGMPELVLDGAATVQRFEKGVIFLTNDFGAVWISNSIFSLWQTLVSAPSLPGSADGLQKYLGRPVKDTFTLPDGSEAAYFERGMIYFRKEIQGEIDLSRKCVVYGEIYDRYKLHGDIAGSLSVPLTGTGINASGGLEAHFDGGSIYWLEGVGMGMVAAEIRDYWNSLGGVTGELGHPITDHEFVLKDGQMVGNFSRFQNGAIYWSEQTGAWDVRGPILKAWEETFGGATGDFGFPISGQQTSLNSGKIFNNFQHGVFVWDEKAPLEKRGLAVKRLEFYIQRFTVTDSDEVGSSGLQVYVIANVGTNSGPIFKRRMPVSGYYKAEVNVKRNVPIPGFTKGQTAVAFDFQGREHDSGPDDALGRIIGLYNVDNGWFLDKGLVKFNDGDFNMVCGMRQPGTPIDPNQSLRAQGGVWSFENFNTDDLSKEQYADTYSDIDAGTLININPATWVNETWEAIFYKLVYDDMAENGNCFGMCLESIYAQVGRSFFTEPIFNHTADEPGLKNEINIKHGYQAGASLINWFVKQFGTGNTHDPVDVFEKSQEAYERGDYPLISISNSYFAPGGHVVRPYAWRKLTPTHWIMLVANPNYVPEGGTPPDSVRPDDAEGCIIHIDRHELGINSKFRFEMNPGEVWEGDEWLGGRMHYIPYSELSTTPRTPGHEVHALLNGGVIVILGNAGQSHQLSDNSGNTFYESDLESPPTQWQEIRRDGNTLLGDVARMPMFGGGGKPVPEIYFVRDTVTTLQHRIAPRPETPPDAPYHWLMRSPAFSAAIALEAASAIEDSISIERSGASARSLSLTLSPEGAQRKAELWLSGWRGLELENKFWFRLHELSLSPKQTIDLRLNEAGRELVLRNDGPEVTCQVSIRDSNTREVLLESGKVTRIRPDWEHPDQPWVVEKAHDSLRHFMESRGLPPQQGIRAYYPSAESVRELIQA
ncbi:MAG TPA: hypothetical protein VM911_06710 [Pyrinomonadaceae bacterium]|jgi:hypothetical protein|nr:hypothetical protein [Pyrinomonadaceae bacterium]